MLFHHPWAADVRFPGGCIAQVLLQNDLGVVLPVSLQLRSPVLDDLLVIVVQGNLVRVGADRIVHRLTIVHVVESARVGHVGDSAIAAHIVALDGDVISDQELFFEMLFHCQYTIWARGNR
jgi:hypothetical protein